MLTEVMQLENGSKSLPEVTVYSVILKSLINIKGTKNDKGYKSSTIRV